MSDLVRILDELASSAKNDRDKGDKFERLTKFFLENDTRYKDRFSDVWLWNKFPLNEGKIDTGIDLVAKEKYGDGHCAIQCKFYGENTTIEKSNIDSFFTASGKKIYTSRLIFSTSNKWTIHAEDALKNQKIPVNRISIYDMEEGSIDWNQFNVSSLFAPQKIKNEIRPHQKKAITDVIKGFETKDRGKLIMACGTGKTFTSLKIAEKIGGSVLFLTPSISLVSQTFNEWAIQSSIKINPIIICSDKTIKADDDDISTYDLTIAPTTDPKLVSETCKKIFKSDELNVIFSTYQSIDVVIKAQEYGLKDFDLIICDEAHRTTGVTLSDRDDTHFTKVHDNDHIKSKRRLYMTATPKIYKESDKQSANKFEADIYSMDDEKSYGNEFHRLGFGEAVEKNLLSDYKVMVLGVEEQYANKFLQQDGELQVDDDIIKIIGCWNGLAKRLVGTKKIEPDQANALTGDPLEGNPMRRAVAFCQRIKDSQRFQKLFSETVNKFLNYTGQKEDFLKCEVDHMDGTMSSLIRKDKLKWLKEDTSSRGNICRIISNAKCMSEGVDVPTLDAVIFLNPKNSYVDVVQSVGRAMRKAEGKKYGYIIIPISIPANIPPEQALNDNKKYKVVWDVCQALRSHDDRFNNYINKIKFNNNSTEILYSQIGDGADFKEESSKGSSSEDTSSIKQLTLDLPSAQVWQNAILGKIAKKCGDTEYWDEWAKSVSTIAENHTNNIKKLLKSRNSETKDAFEKFLKGLRKNINPSVSEEDAIEMLSQHLITKPVFEALFNSYEFVKKNPISKAIQKILKTLEGEEFEKEQVVLNKFYESVKNKVKGIDNPAGKQAIIKELYDKFFNIAFPKMADRLGIVYTPIEIVDFIINSVEDALNSEFNLSLNDKGVHILDPFTGTGTFIVRLLQSRIIKNKNFLYKYLNEIHANEIVLLAYYIAAINIEECFHDFSKIEEYKSFQGITLTDTFQLLENKNEIGEQMFLENNERLLKQNKAQIKVIFGNPPYSAKQGRANDSNQNLDYPSLDNRIEETYKELSTGNLIASLYDSYVRAFRWASDRVDDSSGVICFVTNGSFIDSVSADGLRKSLIKEFDKIYLFNLRGNQRTSGEISRQEGGKIFGSGSRTQVVITLLIKNSKNKTKNKLFYHDIGDYLSREDKLKIIKKYKSINNISWKNIKPNEQGDWINKRDPNFNKLTPIINKENINNNSFFNFYSIGMVTNRDSWIVNFSKKKLINNIRNMINFYNSQVDDYLKFIRSESNKIRNDKKNILDKIINNDPKKISWTVNLKKSLSKGVKYNYGEGSIVEYLYRPFCKNYIYLDKNLIERPSKMSKIFPKLNLPNIFICLPGLGSDRNFSSFISKDIIDNNFFNGGTQCFPLYIYDNEVEKDNNFSLFKTEEDIEQFNGYKRKINITDELFKKYFNILKFKISKEDIFYYIYGILNSSYKEKFNIELKKEIARIPLQKNFKIFSKAGRDLANLHLNYEDLDPYPLKNINIIKSENYAVRKMKFGKNSEGADKTLIIYNENIVLKGIPLEAYNYVINGKSAIEWVMERYQVSIDRDSDIENDPNDYCIENKDPQYILNLLKKVINLSIQSVKIINSLPKIDETIS